MKKYRFILYLFIFVIGCATPRLSGDIKNQGKPHMTDSPRILSEQAVARALDLRAGTESTVLLTEEDIHEARKPEPPSIARTRFALVPLSAWDRLHPGIIAVIMMGFIYLLDVMISHNVNEYKHIYYGRVPGSIKTMIILIPAVLSLLPLSLLVAFSGGDFLARIYSNPMPEIKYILGELVIAVDLAFCFLFSKE